MSKRKGIKRLLTCLMVTSMMGMGFTGSAEEADNDILTEDALHKSAVELIQKNETEEVKEETNDLIEAVESKINVKLTAFTFIIGNKKIGTLQTYKEIEDIIRDIASEYSQSRDENINIKAVDLLEEMDILKEEVFVDEIQTKEEVLDYIKTAGSEIKSYKVKEEESFSAIAAMHNMTVQELEDLNADIDQDNIQAEDEINIKVSKPLLTVVTTEEAQTTNNIDYEIVVEEDAEMYDNESEVKVQGQSGEKKILTKYIRHNGKVVKEEVLSEEVSKEPVKQIVVKGTKEVPKTIATGTFAMPTRGRLSSPFGQRWGRMHRGIDIAKDHGSDIQAADGGEVTFSGVMGTYGNMIEIDHGNGYKTRYAHCSKLLLSPGDKVYQGQVIAKVGSTGRSTGPHLHFEVIKNGVHQNPSGYVK